MWQEDLTDNNSAIPPQIDSVYSTGKSFALEKKTINDECINECSNKSLGLLHFLLTVWP